jgi:hypothetical protein
MTSAQPLTVVPKLTIAEQHEELIDSILMQLKLVIEYGSVFPERISEYMLKKRAMPEQPFGAPPFLNWKEGMRPTEVQLQKRILIALDKQPLCHIAKYRLLGELSKRFDKANGFVRRRLN